MLDTVPTWLALLCTCLAGVTGAVTATLAAPSLPPSFDAGNPLQRAINDALIRGYQSALIGGWEQRHVLIGKWRHVNSMERNVLALDASCLADLVGRGYDTSAGHMHALGWLAHSIGFDVRKYQGAA